MALTQIIVQEIDQDGMVPAYGAANADGSWFLCPKPNLTFIQVYNTNAAARDVTIYAQKENSQGVLVDNVITVELTVGNRMISVADWEIDIADKVFLQYSAVANVTIGVFQRS